MENLPRFSFELIKQGVGNPINYALSDVTDSFRTFLQNYSLANSTLKYWSFEVDEWFASDNSLMDYSIYHLCLTFPNSHTYAGLIQNVALPNNFGSNVILLASSGVEKSIDTGTPYIGGKNLGGEFVFTKTLGNDGNTFNADQLTLTIRDHLGNAVSNSVKIKFKIKYKEYVSF